MSKDNSSIIILDSSIDQLCEQDLFKVAHQTTDNDANASFQNETIPIVVVPDAPSVQDTNTTITLGDSDSDDQDDHFAKQADHEVADLNLILSRLNKISIQSVKKTTCKSKKKVTPSQPEETTANPKTPLHFSMRMKKIYDKASIFDNDN